MPTRLLLEGGDLQELLAQVREEHGARAKIVSAERVRAGGLTGLLRAERYELTVELADDEPAATPVAVGAAAPAASVPAPSPAGGSVAGSAGNVTRAPAGQVAVGSPGARGNQGARPAFPGAPAKAGNGVKPATAPAARPPNALANGAAHPVAGAGSDAPANGGPDPEVDELMALLERREQAAPDSNAVGNFDDVLAELRGGPNGAPKAPEPSALENAIESSLPGALRQESTPSSAETMEFAMDPIFAPVKPHVVNGAINGAANGTGHGYANGHSNGNGAALKPTAAPTAAPTTAHTTAPAAAHTAPPAAPPTAPPTAAATAASTMTPAASASAPAMPHAAPPAMPPAASPAMPHAAPPNTSPAGAPAAPGAGHTASHGSAPTAPAPAASASPHNVTTSVSRQTAGRPTAPARTRPLSPDPRRPNHFLSYGELESIPSETPLPQKLADLGLPQRVIDRLPLGEAYPSIVRALLDEPSAPALPTGPGMIITIIGELAGALAVAEDIARILRLDADRILIASESPQVGRHMADPGDAGRQAARLRGGDQPRLVCVDAPSPTSWVQQVVVALRPDAVWCAVDATRKPADVARQLRSLPRVDALAVHQLEATADPASPLALGVPVALLDGQPAGPHGWAALLSRRLFEDEYVDGDR